MMNINFKVNCAWDDEAGVWYIAESNVPGLAVEAPNEEAMIEEILAAIPELLMANNVIEQPAEKDVPLELLWQRSQMLNLGCA